jgi:hypothetical protein
MGTRSTTHIYNGSKSSDKRMVSIYKQFDGYLSGYGKELFKFLDGYEVLNGYTQDHEKSDKKYANGMDCLGLQLIAHFKQKNKIGGYYLTTANDSQEYDYHIYFVDNMIMIDIYNGSLIFSGNVSDFGLFIESEA